MQSIFFQGLKLNHFSVCIKVHSEFCLSCYIYLENKVKHLLKCVCVLASVAFFFPSACLKGTLDVSFPVLTIMGFNHIGRIFCTALMKGHTYCHGRHLMHVLSLNLLHQVSGHHGRRWLNLWEDKIFPRAILVLKESHRESEKTA